MKQIPIFAFLSIITGLQIEHNDEPCDFPAYRMRFGETCHTKILSSKGKNGHSIMRLIDRVNALLEVSPVRYRQYHIGVFSFSVIIAISVITTI